MTEILAALIGAAGAITAAWLATRQPRRDAAAPNDTPPPGNSKSGNSEDE